MRIPQLVLHADVDIDKEIQRPLQPAWRPCLATAI
jgi:hypothetical protein